MRELLGTPAIRLKGPSVTQALRQMKMRPSPEICVVEMNSISEPRDVLPKYATAAGIAAYLIFLFWGIGTTLYPTLGMPWFSSSDENIIVTEVIRFSGFDFRQDFFDMPGTPLMLIGAAEWRLYYWAPVILHLSSGGIGLFTSQHMQQLFTLMRWNSFLFYLLSAFLLFRIVWRLTDPYSGAAAATLFLFSPAYAKTVYSLRVEPATLCFMLASILVLTESERALRTLWAGVLGGVAAACRLHSITATLPILTILLFEQTWRRDAAYSPRFRRLLAPLGAATFCGSVVLFYSFHYSSGPLHSRYPLAFALLAKACLGVGIFVAGAAGAYNSRKLRPAAVKTITPELVLLTAGIAVGFLAGTPTVLTRYEALLQSLDFYLGPGYRDAAALQLPFHAQLSSYLSFYLKAIVPDILTFALLAAGTGLVIFGYRRRLFLPYLIVGASFFLTKPLTLARAEHHIALWVPFYVVLCAVPIASVFEALRRRSNRYIVLGTGLVMLVLLRTGLRDGPSELLNIGAFHAERVRNIEASRRWIPAHTADGASFMIAFYCFGPEIFETWQRDLGVFLPNARVDGRHYQIWWGNQSALKGRSGYACLTPSDIGYMKQWELRTAGEGIDPLHDGRFVLVQSFGKGPNQVDLLQFDMK